MQHFLFSKDINYKLLKIIVFFSLKFLFPQVVFLCLLIWLSSFILKALLLPVLLWGTLKCDTEALCMDRTSNSSFLRECWKGDDVVGQLFHWYLKSLAKACISQGYQFLPWKTETGLPAPLEPREKMGMRSPSSVRWCKLNLLVQPLPLATAEQTL